MENKFNGLHQKIILTDILRKKSMSIAQLLRETGMKRATCIYYINQLEAEGLIKKTRIEEGKIGRPTIIEIQEKHYLQKRKELNEKMKREQSKIFKECSQNPLIKKILNLLKQNPNVEFIELLDKPEIKNSVKNFQITNWLHRQGFIEMRISLTKKGEKYLLEHKSKAQKKVTNLL